jgi:periplasmic copper chaperone A
MKAPMKWSLAVLLGTCAMHASAASSSMMVSDCWIRPLPGNVPSGGYFKAMNMSAKPIDLTGVETDAFGMAMLHRTEKSGDTSKMVMVDKVSVPAGGTLAFAPGSYHLMLEQPKHALKPGSSLPFTFVFSDGEKVKANCAVKTPGAMAE